MSFQLPCGQHVIYAAAPDAIDPRKCTERIGSEPLEREEDFLKAGYEAGPPFSYPTDAKKQCRIWRSQRASAVDVPLDAYVEIKKTTHLNGLNGSYKLLKYWLQAALVKAGAVCVAFADDTGDVSHTETFTMHRIEKELQERFQDRDLLSKVWASLYSSLQHLPAATSHDTRRTLRLRKRRGYGEQTQVQLEEGWGEMASAMEEDPFEQRAVQLFTPEVP